MSIAGKISDQILAATITPEAKPRSVLCTKGDEAIQRSGKKTMAAPRIVPRTGRRRRGSIVVFSERGKAATV
jgi:hypothetical protein